MGLSPMRPLQKKSAFFRDHFAITGIKPSWKAKLTTRLIFIQVLLDIHSGKPTPMHSNCLNQIATVTFTTTWKVVVPFTTVTAYFMWAYFLVSWLQVNPMIPSLSNLSANTFPLSRLEGILQTAETRPRPESFLKKKSHDFLFSKT